MILTFKDNKNKEVKIKVSIKNIQRKDYNLYDVLKDHFKTEYDREYQEFNLIKIEIMDL